TCTPTSPATATTIPTRRRSGTTRARASTPTPRATTPSAARSTRSSPAPRSSLARAESDTLVLRMRLVPALLALTLATSVHAEPVTLRLATIAPQGSGWAREFSAWARDIEVGTHGAVRMKIYYSAIGGDEFTV